MSESEELWEIAKLAAEAVATDGAGELPYYLLGVENYNRLIDLLVGLEMLNEGYLKEKVEPILPKKRELAESTMSSPISYGAYTIRHSYRA